MQNELFSLLKKYGLQMRLHLLSEFCVFLLFILIKRQSLQYYEKQINATHMP